jgi:hypothetical protein
LGELVSRDRNRVAAFSHVALNRRSRIFPCRTCGRTHGQEQIALFSSPYHLLATYSNSSRGGSSRKRERLKRRPREIGPRPFERRSWARISHCLDSGGRADEGRRQRRRRHVRHSARWQPTSLRRAFEEPQVMPTRQKTESGPFEKLLDRHLIPFAVRLQHHSAGDP